MKTFMFAFVLVCFVINLIGVILINDNSYLKLFAIVGWVIAILFLSANYIGDILLEENKRVIRFLNNKLKHIEKNK